jgi:CheY-like chemotaxis protein
MNVLIIDDDVWIARVLQKIFTSLEIIEKVFVTNEGFYGVAAALKEKPDVIFLDILMPDMDGIQTLKLLKTIEETKDISVVMVSGNSDVQKLGTAISLGATDYISKPFTSQTIKDKLDKLYKDKDAFTD